VPTELADRVISLSAEEMRAIPEILVIPHGIPKVRPSAPPSAAASLVASSPTRASRRPS
jgi:hypothetical protein